MKEKVLAIITARGGSKGIPQKNIKPLQGKPLIAYSITAALHARTLDKIIVSTDDETIATISKDYGAEVPFLRPKHLATDTATSISVLQHAVRHMEEHEGFSADIIVCLQPTSPLRSSDDIDQAVTLCLSTGADSVVSMCPVQYHPYWMKKIIEGEIHSFLEVDDELYPRRQDLPPAYQLNGAIYVIRRKVLLEEQKMLGAHTLSYIIPEERSIDIDTPFDFRIAELIMRDQNQHTKTVLIGNKVIGDNHPVFIIAEAGVNHNGDIHLAKQLVDVAAEAGADAVKFQTFITEEIVTRHAEKADYQKQNTGSKQESQFEMLKKLELSFENFRELKTYCDEKGIMFLSTPFDQKSIDFLDELGVPAFKISSGEINNYPLLNYVAAKRKPIILSTGMSTLAEVERAVELLFRTHHSKLALLHCTSDYPAKVEDVNLRAMKTICQTFHLPVGLSDHTQGIEISLAAVAMGASIIEKHFTTDKSLAGPDHKASLRPLELKELVKAIRNIEKALGSGEKIPVVSEMNTRLIARKSIVAARSIKKGETLSEHNLTVKRPGNGISPMRWSELIGKNAVRDFVKDELIVLDQHSRV
jgi:N,N'-diacetyllegionaminate synthase